jgi:hypothetical protein
VRPQRVFSIAQRMVKNPVVIPVAKIGRYVIIYFVLVGL